MESKKVLRTMGWIVLIGAIAAGIMLSIAKVPDMVTSYGSVITYKKEFHPFVLLAWVAGGIIGSVWFFAASDALYFLERTAKASEEIRNKLCEKPMQKDFSTPHVTQYGTANSGSSNPSVTKRDDWICDKCGRVNASYVSSCGCGRSKRDCLAAMYKKKEEERQSRQ